MMDKLKQTKELIGEKLTRLEEIELLCDKESRAWNQSEEDEVTYINNELDKLIKTRDLLLKTDQVKRDEAKLAFDVLEEKETSEEKEKRGVKVTGANLKTKEACYAKTFSLIQARMVGDFDKTKEARDALIEGGHFDAETRNFSTLVDGKGGILVPKLISESIWDLEQLYGFIPANANNFGNILQSELKIPNILGRPTFSAVNQQSAISGSGFNLGGITLKPLKWGAIIDWTNEVDESVGAKLMPIIMNKVAEALAYAKDNTFINGDGTSTYHNIKGLTSLVGNFNYVRQATAASGNVSHATLDADDFQLPILNVTPGARSGGVYLMHPNMLLVLQKIKDGQGMYIYGNPSEMAPVGTLFGYPIKVSEAFPFTDSTSEQVCAFLNPNHIAYANGRELRADNLKEGSITNESGTTVNLATQDAQAIRFTALFDMAVDNNVRTSVATAQGAFSLLRTAAS